MNIETSAIVELRQRASAGIFAIPYRRGCRGRAVRLPDGAIVEVPTSDLRLEAPIRPEPIIGVTIDGAPATIHHANLGLISAYVEFEGVYLLPQGEVAAVYGAETVSIG
jgi:hypothetical protein